MTAQTKSTEPAFTDGEWLRYKMSYSGFLRAGTAELQLKETEISMLDIESINSKKRKFEVSINSNTINQEKFKIFFEKIN